MPEMGGIALERASCVMARCQGAENSRKVIWLL